MADVDSFHPNPEEEVEEEMEVDPFLFALTVAEENLSADDDQKLAEELQLQEVLVSSANTIRPCTDAGRNRSDSNSLCDICDQPMPPTDVLQKPPCPHAVCSVCLCRYVDGVLQRHKSMVNCPHAGCEAVLEPELYREIVPPRLFDAWFDAHHRGGSAGNKGAIIRGSRQDGRQKSTIISVARLHVEDPSKDPSFQISIHGRYNRGTVVKLANIMLDALEASREGSDDSEGKQLATAMLDAIEAPRERSDDSKGKQIVVFQDAVTELGESSNADQVADGFDCSICMETKPITDSFDVNSCSHRFCKSCMRQYVTAKVEANATSIECPDPECKEGTLEPEMCRAILPEGVFDRWGVALCESALGTTRFYCPFKDCSALLMNDGGDGDEEMTETECPHCHRMLCAQCRVPWHGGINCEGFQQLDEDERGREDLMLRKLATDSKWQRCPQCRIYVEKISGCMFMNCRCGYGFCYGCASPMPKDYHYCQRCHR